MLLNQNKFIVLGTIIEEEKSAQNFLVQREFMGWA